MNRRERLLRAWPAAVALAVFLIHIPYLSPGGPWARKPEPVVLGQDEGTVLYDSLRITNGEVMYDDFFMFQGPVFYYTYAGLFAVVGPSFTAARALHLVTSALGAALLALIVARFAGRAAGVSAALIHACVLMPMWPFTYPHWMAETLALGALALLTVPEPSRRAQLLAGALAGLSLLTIQSVGLPVLVAVMCVQAAPGLAARDLRRALTGSARILAGAAAAIAPILLYFTAHGALGKMYYAMFEWSMNHYKHGNDVAYGWWTTESIELHRKVLEGPWESLAVYALRLTNVLPFLALGAAAIVWPWAIYSLLDRRRDFRFALIGGAAIAGVSSLFLAPVRPDLNHVAYLGSFGLLGAAVALSPLVKRFRQARLAVGALFLLVALPCAATYAHKTHLTWDKSRKLADWRGEARKLSGFATIERDAPPGERIVVGAMGGFYYFFARPSAVAHTYIPATYEKLLSETQWRRIGSQIVERRPWALLLVGKQWGQITKYTPEVAKLYKAQGGLWRRVE